jgi:hypothetical protein
MAARKRPGDEDRREALKLALGGLAAGRDLGGLVFDLRELHPRNNTFPGEVLLELAADAIEESGATRGEPIDYEDIREQYLPEATFRGRNEHHRSHYALGAAGMIRAGVQPDLLGEIQWWGTDDLWEYALYALVVYVRIAAERSGQSVGEICARLAARHGLEIADLSR